MTREAPPDPALRHTESHTTFFRQSGWLALATVVSGVMMTAVQVIASHLMRPEEYGAFFALLRVYLLMSLPTAGLQMIFAQQAAAAVTAESRRELTGTVRTVLGLTFLLWVFMAFGAWQVHGRWAAAYQLSNPAALWATVGIGLASLWTPVFRGVMQGEQNFLGLGSVMMVDGLGRLVAVTLILKAGGQAAGGITGALVGQTVALLFAVGWLRRVLWAPASGLPWGRWLRRAGPMALGVGAVQFMTNADTVYVKGVFPAEVANYHYIPAAMIGLAMVMIVTPVAAVMFPKIARSAALSQGSRALELALGATVLVTVLAATACTVFPRLPLQILFFGKPEFWVAAPLVPWFAWCLSPLIVANVLIGNLLARERFAVVPWVVVVALSYGGALWLLSGWLPLLPTLAALRTVLEALGIFGGALCVIAAVFTWCERDRVGAAAR